MYEKLFSPIKINNVEIKNRFVMPGMGANMYGLIDENDIAWYERRAKGGYGLIITEYTAVKANGRAFPSEAVINEETDLAGYIELVERVHKCGAKIFMQLHHAGRQTNSFYIQDTPVSASPIPCPSNRNVVSELETEEVYDIIEAFGIGAAMAKKAGFDGVEIHGGHGYLVAQFMSPYVNRRTDEFGGDVEGRAKFGVEIVKNIKAKCGTDFPVSFRLSVDEHVDSGRTIRESVIQCRLLELVGVDVINASTSVYASMPYAIGPYNLPMAFNIDNAEAIKKAVSIPVIGVGRLNDPLVMEDVICEGKCDMVITGRACITDPDLPNKVKDGNTGEICPCIGCMTRCQGMIPENPEDGFILGCAMNPFAGPGREISDFQIRKAEKSKNVVVVGAGVGGLEAAWVAAACGHKVTLLEKSNKLGGQALIATIPPNKHEIARGIRYFITMCKKYGVDIKLNTEATKELILSYNPDAVIIATGGVPIVPPIPNDGIEIVQANEVVGGKVVAGDNVLVVGGGLVGIETAEYLVSQMRKPTVVEMQDTVGDDFNDNVKHFVFKYLKENEVPIHTNTKVQRFTEDGAVCSTPDGEIVFSGYDMAVLALGSKPNNVLKAALDGEVSEIYVIGDANGSGNMRSSIDEGAHVAVSL